MFWSEKRFCYLRTNSKNQNLVEKLETNLEESTAKDSSEDEIQILETIQAKRNNFQKALNQAEGIRLKDGSRLIDTDSTLKERISSIKEAKLSPEEQEAILAEIQTRQEQFDKLIKLSSNKNQSRELQRFQNIDLDDREKQLARREKHKKILEQLKLASKDQELSVEIFEDLGEEGQIQEIKRLESALESIHLNKILEEAPKRLQQAYFESLGFKMTQDIDYLFFTKPEKERAIEGMKSILRQEYQALYRNNHKFSSRDIELFDAWANGNLWTFKAMEECIKEFEKARQMAEEVQEKSQKYPPNSLELFNWSNLSTFERKKLLDSGQLENPSHLTLLQNYKNNLSDFLPGQKYGKFGLISRKSAQEQEKWFSQKSLAEKQAILDNPKDYDYFFKTLNERKQANQTFSELSPQIQAEHYKQYLEASHQERLAILDKIQADCQKLRQDFEEKIKTYIQGHLIPKNKQNSYLKHFQKLNLSEQRDFLQSLAKEMQERQTNLDIFQEEILPNLAKPDRKKYEAEFYKADHKARLKLLNKWLRIYQPDKNLQELLDKQGVREAQNKAELSAIEFTLNIILENARELAEQGHKQGAIALYKKWLKEAKKTYETISDEEFRKINQELRTIQTETLDLDECSDEALDPVLSHQIEVEIAGIIKADQKLQNELNDLELLQELGQNLRKRDQLRELGQAEQSTYEIHLQIQEANELEDQTKAYLSKQSNLSPDERFDLDLNVSHQGQDLSADQYDSQILRNKTSQLKSKLSQEIQDKYQETHPQCELNDLIPHIINKIDLKQIPKAA